MILLIDNYDSFVHNLARYLRRLGQETKVVRNDILSVASIRQLNADAIVLSPGPGSPSSAGCCLEVVRQLWREMPILGVCLGHQAIAAAFGAAIVRAREPMHGKTSEILHGDQGLFRGLPDPLRVARYHSLVVDDATLTKTFHRTAHASDGTIMSIEHENKPVVGWQFHPESILTDQGYTLLAAFLDRAGLQRPQELPSETPNDSPAWQTKTDWPSRPVTF